KEIDLKKAATVTGNKKVELLHVKDLLATTGYVRGGCSPIGMKKKFPTFIEQSALDFDKITVSAGMKGAQLLLRVDELIKFTGAKLCQIV
ncbi:MAG: Cys-tRNA(Pro) deacylase, partial [Clostridia bacterium]|nr:Cys-tRNA(Pro) deacylase [Clostridia bacterium]